MKTPMLPRNQAARRSVEALPEIFASPLAAIDRLRGRPCGFIVGQRHAPDRESFYRADS